MENTDQIHSFIRLVMNENLAQAQSVIHEALNTKLSAALDEKFEAYAPAIFEELDPSEEEEGEEEEGEEEGDEGDEGDEQQMQNAPQTMQQYSAPTGGAGSVDSDGY